jgi:hypothetical protein
MKKETLEEAAEKLSKNAYKKHSVKDDKLSLDEQIQRSGGFIVGFKEGMIAGAKWQSERMYSEEEVIIILNKFGSNVYGNYTRNEMMCDFVERWFEQFKK